MLPEQIAIVLWAVLFCMLYGQRPYYFALCGLLALIGGAAALEYAPALWFPVEFVLGFSAVLRRQSDYMSGRRGRV